MRNWQMAGEPSLEELLGDEMMGAVTRSAGIDRSTLLSQLAELAQRLPAERLTPRAARWSSCACHSPAA